MCWSVPGFDHFNVFAAFGVFKRSQYRICWRLKKSLRYEEMLYEIKPSATSLITYLNHNPTERARVNDDSVHANDWHWPETPAACASGPKETGTGGHEDGDYEEEEEQDEDDDDDD